MGQCGSRDPDDGDQTNQAPRPALELLELGSAGADDGGWFSSASSARRGQLRYRVCFRLGRPLDAEGVAIKSLAELLWPGRNMPRAAATWGCVGALRTLLKAQSDTLLDLVVPVTNVVLHAPLRDARGELWNSFVLEAVKTDSILAHLFYWALKAVVASPQVDPDALSDAQAKLAQVSRTLTTSASNAATPRGKGVTPLIDLLERLHRIGESIVPEKDKDKRKALLHKLLDDEVNKKPMGGLPVPALLLSGNGLRRRPGSQVGAKVLRLPPREAAVLSSKERAPYLVLVELEECLLPTAEGDGSVRGFGLCCRRKARNPELEGLLASVGAQTDEGVPGRAAEVSRSTASVVEGEIATYLQEQDRRPRGIFKSETWSQVVHRVRKGSWFGNRTHWNLLPLIIKSNADDVRQEELAYRLLKWFQRTFKRHELNLWLHPFLIVATTHDGGALEVVSNAISLSELKKGYGEKWRSLRTYFEQTFPNQELATNGHESEGKQAIPLSRALGNYVSSMAAYSVVCYVLAIRDRHNGNILIDDEGHIIHVDFGFMLCGAPGGRALQQMGGFELSSGFKLTSELCEVFGDPDHKPFQLFRQSVYKGLQAVREHVDELLALLQVSLLGDENNKMGCFDHPKGYPEAVLEDLCGRLRVPSGSRDSQPGLNDEEFSKFIDQVVEDSMGHWRSRMYDKYQYHFTGVH